MWPSGPGRLETDEPVRGVDSTSVTGDHGGERLRRLAAGLLGVATWLWAVAVLAAVGLLWWSGDRWWPGTVLLFGPRWTLGLPAVLLLPAIVFLDRRLLWPLGVGLALYVVPLLGFRASIPNMERPDDLIILTANVAGGGGMDEPVTDFVARSGADLIAVQECPHRIRRRSGRLDVDGYQSHSHMSLCFWSRFPFRVGGTTGMTAVPDSTTGMAVRYEVALGSGDTVSVTNLHLPTPRAGLEHVRRGRLREGAAELERSRELRIRAAQDAQRVADQGGPHRIVLGDFNAPPESRIQRRYWGDYSDAFARAGLGFGFTRYNGWIRARIDHVLLSGGLEAVSAVVGEDVGSDHRPVWVRVRLR